MDLPRDGVLELKKYHTWMGEDGIARTRVKPDAEIFIQDAKENTAAVTSFFKGQKFPLLVDIRQIKSISNDAREHFSMRGRDTVVSAYAIVMASALSRMIGNFFLLFHKPVVPVKLFNHEEDALNWLDTYKVRKS